MPEIETPSEDPVQELKDWLFGRVADDRDIVVDEMQEEFAQLLDKEDEDSGIEGTEQYKQNVKLLETSIAEIQKPGCSKALVSQENQKITDGIMSCWYGGHKDSQGRPHGEGMLKYVEGKNEPKMVFQGFFEHGVWNRTGKLSTGSSFTEGTWKNSLMEGEMKVQTACGWIEGYWSKGVPHGYQREFGANDIKGNRELRFLGRYFRGIPRGFCWKGMYSGAFLCGYVDKDGEFTGNDLAFIYPDFKTVLRGQFDSEKLVKGQKCELIGFDIEKGIAVPKFTKTSGPVYTFEDANKISIGKNPLLRDPWEEGLVYVRESSLPQGGEGLFAKKDIKAKELFCLFNGVRIRTCTLASKYASHSDYRIRLNADIDLDIPDDCVGLDQYCATLGHKANHSNLPNADWAIIEHPRFGLIRALVSQSKIKKDEEILINYHMNLADSPEWYRKVWLRHQREHKRLKDESIIRILDRYYENTGKRVDLTLDDDDFFVPPPKGVDNLAELPDDEESVNAQEQLDMAKKMLKA